MPAPRRVTIDDATPLSVLVTTAPPRQRSRSRSKVGSTSEEADAFSEKLKARRQRRQGAWAAKRAAAEEAEEVEEGKSAGAAATGRGSGPAKGGAGEKDGQLDAPGDQKRAKKDKTDKPEKTDKKHDKSKKTDKADKKDKKDKKDKTAEAPKGEQEDGERKQKKDNNKKAAKEKCDEKKDKTPKSSPGADDAMPPPASQGEPEMAMKKRPAAAAAASSTLRALARREEACNVPLQLSSGPRPSVAAIFAARGFGPSKEAAKRPADETNPEEGAKVVQEAMAAAMPADADAGTVGVAAGLGLGEPSADIWAQTPDAEDSSAAFRRLFEDSPSPLPPEASPPAEPPQAQLQQLPPPNEGDKQAQSQSQQPPPPPPSEGNQQAESQSQRPPPPSEGDQQAQSHQPPPPQEGDQQQQPPPLDDPTFVDGGGARGLWGQGAGTLAFKRQGMVREDSSAFTQAKHLGSWQDGLGVPRAFRWGEVSAIVHPVCSAFPRHFYVSPPASQSSSSSAVVGVVVALLPRRRAWARGQAPTSSTCLISRSCRARCRRATQRTRASSRARCWRTPTAAATAPAQPRCILVPCRRGHLPFSMRRDPFGSLVFQRRRSGGQREITKGWPHISLHPWTVGVES